MLLRMKKSRLPDHIYACAVTQWLTIFSTIDFKHIASYSITTWHHFLLCALSGHFRPTTQTQKVLMDGPNMVKWGGFSDSACSWCRELIRLPCQWSRTPESQLKSRMSNIVFHSVTTSSGNVTLRTVSGHVIAQAVRHRFLPVDTRVCYRDSLYEICGGQRGTGTGFSPSP